MNNDIVFWIISGVNIVFLCVLVFYIINIIKEFNKIKKELNKAIKDVYDNIDIGEFYTFNDGNEIVISNKYQQNNKFYFEYKYVNHCTKPINDVTNDEHYTVKVTEFAKLVKHYGGK